jgi:hypothetical protein
MPTRLLPLLVLHCFCTVQVRRAKLYYLRDRTGKSARLKELFVKKDKAAAN